MRNVSLVVSYDGTNYHGWQCQPAVRTVEETLRQGTEKIVNHPVKLYAGGRTDAGVHAIGQVVNFHTTKDVPLKGFVRGLNSILPRDIRIQSASEADPSFHARYSAKSKTYLYSILNRETHSPFYVRYAWHIPFSLDKEAMDDTLDLVLGKHDFSAFKKKDEYYHDPVREVLRVETAKRGDFLSIFIEATGFLRYMVRNIVGTVVMVGQGKLSKDRFSNILNSKDREQAGPTAPPQGLFLKEILY